MLCVYITLCLSIDAMPTFLAVNFAPSLVERQFCLEGVRVLHLDNGMHVRPSQGNILFLILEMTEIQCGLHKITTVKMLDKDTSQVSTVHVFPKASIIVFSVEAVHSIVFQKWNYIRKSVQR